MKRNKQTHRIHKLPAWCRWLPIEVKCSEHVTGFGVCCVSTLCMAWTFDTFVKWLIKMSASQRMLISSHQRITSILLTRLIKIPKLPKMISLLDVKKKISFTIVPIFQMFEWQWRNWFFDVMVHSILHSFFISNWTQGSALSCLVFRCDLRAQNCLWVA